MKIEDHPAFHGGNFKAKCVWLDPEQYPVFTLGKVYEVKSGTIRTDTGFAFDDGFESIKQINDRLASAKFGAVTDLPRICYILGGEKTPLKINEEFRVTNRDATYRIADDGDLQYRNDDMEFFAFCNTDTIYDLINGTQHIIRRPQFSDDEKALMRLLVKNGLPWIGRDDDTDSLFAYAEKPTSEDGCFSSNGEEQGIPDCLMRQITSKSSPFDAAAYLESEEAK